MTGQWIEGRPPVILMGQRVRCVWHWGEFEGEVVDDCPYIMQVEPGRCYRFTRSNIVAWQQSDACPGRVILELEEEL